MPGFCNVLLSHGRGLGRSLNCGGRREIRLLMMLYGGAVHKFPFAAASEALAWNRCATVAFLSCFKSRDFKSKSRDFKSRDFKSLRFGGLRCEFF